MASDAVDLSDLDADTPAAQCRVATNAVLDVALEHCGDEALTEMIGSMVGVQSDVDQLIADAPDTLESGDCLDIQAVRGWVVARTVELVQSEGEQVADAITTAWAEANDTCGWG